MKHPLTISMCAGFLLASLGGSGVWAEPAVQEPAVTYAFSGGVCGTSMVLGVSTQGNKTHLQLLNTGVMVSTDPRVAGPVVVNVEVIINNVNGHIGGHGSLVLHPAGYAGTWSADFNFQTPGGKSIDVGGIIIVKDSRINARGTGEFDGQWFFIEHGIAVSGPPYDIPVEGPEGCVFMGEIWNGSILNPNSA